VLDNEGAQVEEQDVIRVGMIQKRVTFELTEGLTDESQTRLD